VGAYAGSAPSKSAPDVSSILCVGVGAQSTLGGKTFLPEKYVQKVNKMPEFHTILARKIVKYPNFYDICPKKNNKIPEFYMIFVRKMPEFYIIIARKNIFPKLLRGDVPPAPGLLHL